MKDVLPQLDAWRARGLEAALATVVSVVRSAPQPPGAKLAVSSAGDVAGAVSGGCVEGSVVLAAEEVLGGAPPRLVRFGFADEEARDVGLPCGGEIDVWIARHDDDRLAALARHDRRGAQVTRLDDGKRLVVGDDGRADGSLGDAALDAAAAALAERLRWSERSERHELDGVPVFVDVVGPAPRLVLFGAVDVAARLCTLARGLGWRPFVVDPRTRFASAQRFPDAEAVVAAWPGEAFARIGAIDRATAIAVLTHDPKLDDAALTLALASDACYVGAMGSRRAQARRRDRLSALGVADADLDRLAAPIGLDLGGLTAAETALSIMAEIVAARRGHAGGRLRDARGRIHEI